MDGARWQDIHTAKNATAKSNGDLDGSVWITANIEIAVVVIDLPAFHLQARLRPLLSEYSLISSLCPQEARLPVDLGKIISASPKTRSIPRYFEDRIAYLQLEKKDPRNDTTEQIIEGVDFIGWLDYGPGVVAVTGPSTLLSRLLESMHVTW